METTNFGHRADGSGRHRLDGAQLGRVLVERQMRSSWLVVVHVYPEPRLKVPLVEQGGVSEQLATDCSAHALDIRILQRRTRGRNQFGDANSFDPLAKTM